MEIIIKKLPIIELVLIVLSFLMTVFFIGFNIGGPIFFIVLMGLASFYMFGTILLVNTLNGKKISDSLEVVVVLASQPLLSISIVGILFKTMSFPGSSVYLMISAISLLLLSILITLKQFPFYMILLKRIMFFGLLSGILYWMPISTWVHFRYHFNPHYADVYTKYLENQRDSTARQNWIIEREKLFQNK